MLCTHGSGESSQVGVGSSGSEVLGDMVSSVGNREVQEICSKLELLEEAWTEHMQEFALFVRSADFNRRPNLSCLLYIWT